MGQINSPTDGLTEDEVLNFGVEDLIADDDQIYRRPFFCAPTDQILTNHAVNQLNPAIPLNQYRQIMELMTLLKLNKS